MELMEKNEDFKFEKPTLKKSGDPMLNSGEWNQLIVDVEQLKEERAKSPKLSSTIDNKTFESVWEPDKTNPSKDRLTVSDRSYYTGPIPPPPPPLPPENYDTHDS